MVLDRRCRPSARGILVLGVLLCGHLAVPRLLHASPPRDVELVEPDTLVYELPPIEVTATRMTPTLYHSPASVSVLTWRRLEARHVRTGSEMLEEVPSVVIERTRKGAFGCPTIRGFGTSNILVLLDGMPVNTGFGNWPNLLSLPMNDVERIVVVKGSNAILYGPNAMGGVVNITTGRAEGRQPLFASAELGSDGLERYRASYGERRAGWDYLVTASRDATDGYRPNTDSDINGLDGRLWHEDERWKLLGAAGIRDGEVGIPIETSTPQRWDVWRNARGSISLNYRIAPWLSTWTSAHVHLERNRLITYSDTTFAEVESDFYTECDTYGGEVLGNLFLGTDHTATVGAQLRIDEADVIYLGGKRTSTIRGLFLRDMLVLGDVLTLTGGLRADDATGRSERLNYNLGLIWRPWGRERSFARLTKLRVLYGTATRFPALRELYMTAPNPGRGDEGLATEESRTLEAGIEHVLPWFVTASLSAFETRATNLIERDMSTRPWYFANLGKARMRGAEMELGREAPGEPGVSVAVAWLDATDEESGEQPIFRPRIKATGGVRWKKYGLRPALTVRYVGDQAYDEYNKATKTSTRRETESYVLTDTKIAYSFERWGEVSFPVDNLLNEPHLLEGHPQLLPVVPGPGRRYAVGYSIGR